MNLIADIFKYLNSPIVSVGLMALIAAFVILFITFSSTGNKKQVLYLSEAERQGSFMGIDSMTPKTLNCGDNMRFFRRAVAYTVKQGAKTLTLWLAKRGSAYTFNPAKTPRGKAVKIGTLSEALETIWSKELIDKLEPKYKDPLLKSEIFVTVDLEGGFEPDGLPPLDETGIKSEANQNMADLVGLRIKDALRREDWIRNIGLGAAGIVVWETIKNLGIF